MAIVKTRDALIFITSPCWALLGLALLPLLIIIVPLYFYVKHQIRSYRLYKKLVHAAPDGPAWVEDVANQPATVLWTVRCPKHKSNGRYVNKTYNVTRQWPSEIPWTVKTTTSGQTAIFEEPCVKVRVKVATRYRFETDFPEELKEVENEIREEHSECYLKKFSLERQVEIVAEKYVVKQGFFTTGRRVKYWLSSIFCCSCCTDYLDKEIEYTVEKTHPNYDTDEMAIASASERQEKFPPSYRDIEANQPAPANQQPAAQSGNAADTSVTVPPSYNEYTTAVTYQKSSTQGDAYVSGTEQVSINVTDDLIAPKPTDDPPV